MTGRELNRPTEQTPQELNTEFRKFLEHVPDPLPDPGLLDIAEGDLTSEELDKYTHTEYHSPPETLEWIRKLLRGHLKVKTISRARKTSPELANLSAKLLLLLGRSLITPSFQQEIVKMFRSAYEGGKPREQDELSTSSAVYETLLEYMDMDEPESAGIFDPARAEIIERKAYQDTAFGLAFVVGIINTAVGSETFADIMADPEKQNPMFKHRLVPQTELARRWRQEFVQHYRTQP